jgi:hypothetical protein
MFAAVEGSQTALSDCDERRGFLNEDFQRSTHPQVRLG